MINGNSVKLQIGKESAYGTQATATDQFKISSESLKATYNKIDEGLATGGRGQGLKATMGIGVEGSAATLFRADMGYILHGALGVKETSGESAPYSHKYTCIASAENLHLPSFTVKVDRKIDVFAYTGCKINTLSLSAAAGDYLKADISFIGKDEVPGASLQSLTPSPLKAFKFAQGKLYRLVDGERVEIADVDSMGLEINNNLDRVQTTSTGDYFSESEVGTREISLTASCIYSSEAEALRNKYYKSDDTLAVVMEFVSDEKSGTGEDAEANKMTITLPCVQLSDASANMGGLETLKQSMTFNVVDNLSEELIEVTLVNGSAE